MRGFEIDTEARSSYLRINAGRVSTTKGLSEDVFADMDRTGNVIGIEFVGLDALKEAANLVSAVAEVPSKLDYTIDRETHVEVEAVSGNPPETLGTRVAQCHFAFAAGVLTGAQAIGEIPAGSVLIINELGIPTARRQTG